MIEAKVRRLALDEVSRPRGKSTRRRVDDRLALVEAEDAVYQARLRSLLEGGFSGTITDKRGRKRVYVDGKQVSQKAKAGTPVPKEAKTAAREKAKAEKAAVKQAVKARDTAFKAKLKQQAQAKKVAAQGAAKLSMRFKQVKAGKLSMREFQDTLDHFDRSEGDHFKIELAKKMGAGDFSSGADAMEAVREHAWSQYHKARHAKLKQKAEKPQEEPGPNPEHEAENERQRQFNQNLDSENDQQRAFNDKNAGNERVRMNRAKQNDEDERQRRTSDPNEEFNRQRDFDPNAEDTRQRAFNKEIAKQEAARKKKPFWKRLLGK